MLNVFQKVHSRRRKGPDEVFSHHVVVHGELSILVRRDFEGNARYSAA